MKDNFSQISKTFILFQKDDLGLINDYRCRFDEYINDFGIDADKLKKEIKEAKKSIFFSWSSCAKKHKFAFYHPKKTDEETFLDFYFFTKDSLYPEKILTNESRLTFETWLLENLSNSKWKSLHELIDKFNNSSAKLQLVDEIDFFQITTKMIKRRWVFNMKHKIGTNIYYFKLRCKKEDILKIKKREIYTQKVIFPIIYEQSD